MDVWHAGVSLCSPVYLFDNLLDDGLVLGLRAVLL